MLASRPEIAPSANSLTRGSAASGPLVVRPGDRRTLARRASLCPSYATRTKRRTSNERNDQLHTMRPDGRAALQISTRPLNVMFRHLMSINVNPPARQKHGVKERVVHPTASCSSTCISICTSLTLLHPLAGWTTWRCDGHSRLVAHVHVAVKGRSEPSSTMLSTQRPAALLVASVLLAVTTLPPPTNRIHFDFASWFAPGVGFYETHAADFLGGYTVSGNALSFSQDAGYEQNSFSVTQECICSASATSTGIFAKGANAENAFLLVVAREPDGNWYAQQTSVGVAPAYQATMRFGRVPGGPHTAVGYQLASTGNEQTAFRADQSAIGCSVGVGAGACEKVCGDQGLSWAQIRDKCGFSP